MRTKNAKRITDKESDHLRSVKELPCSVCDAEGPSEAHHMSQGNHWTAIALCVDCHRGHNGWHGTKAFWKIRKLTELDALAATIRRLHGE